MESTHEFAQHVAKALTQVVEEARWDARISSGRELARLAGMTHTALNKRMLGEVIFNVRDLAAIGVAVGVPGSELLARAIDAVRRNNVVALPESSAHASRVGLGRSERAAAKKRNRRGEDEPESTP